MTVNTDTEQMHQEAKRDNWRDKEAGATFMHKNVLQRAAFCISLFTVSAASAAPKAVGAAPKGDAKKVAEKIIRANFTTCKQLGGAARKPDGSIKATCSGVEYLVFTVFNPKEGRAMELAMNCAVAKKHLNITC